MLNRRFTLLATVLALAAGCSEQRDLAPVAASVSITSLTPVSGVDTGGTALTINGAGFVAGTTVSVGGAAATSVALVSGFQLTCVTPAGTAGPVDVVVTVPGPASDTAVNGFTYTNGPAPSPTVARVDPTSGPIAGGTTITLTGTGFQTGATVTLGGAAGTSVTVLTAGVLTFVSPAGSAGAASIVVTNPDATNVTVAGGFTYGTPTPTVTAINVNTGPVAGGTAVTITGTGFEAFGTTQPTVLIGGAAATSVTAVSATTITAVTGAAAVVGPQNVQVTNPNANSGTGANLYTYVGPNPAPTALNPAIGPQAGGTTTTITGTNFYPGATVTVAGTAATVGTITPTTIVITTAVAANPNGPATVIVTNADGNNGTLNNGFFFQGAAPTISSVSPTNGPQQGGNTVTITGTNFRTGVTVTIGGNAATVTGGTLPTSIEVTAPLSATSGAATVVVTNTDLTTVSGAYTYNPAPAITSITPTNGTSGNAFTITGTNFLTGATVLFGATSAGAVTVTATQITGTVPAGPGTGALTVTVTNPDLQTATVGFTYNPAPTLTGLSPTGGPLAGGTTVTLTGTGFISGASVSWNAGLISATFVSATTLTVTAPAGSAGGVTVFVQNPDTQTSGNQTYTYAAAPTLTSLNPNNGVQAGGGTCTLTGANFVSGASVSWNGGFITTTFVNSSSLTVTIPSGTGSVTVFVRNPDLQVSGNQSYTYNPAPAITSINPTNGTSGNLFTITGSNFLTGATVLFGATNAGAVTVTATQITGTVPSGPGTGALTVTVTNPDTQTATVGFTYNPAPTVTSVQPTAGGPNIGGNTVTINGTGFLTGVTVTFGGNGAAVTSFSATQLLVTAPNNGGPGTVTVTVTNLDGQSATGSYTFNNAPSVTSINPTNGFPTNAFTITGSDFLTGATVSFGATSAGAVTVGATQITGTVPSGPTGTVTVTVTNPDGQTATTSFTYNPPPSITAINPTNGTSGNLFTITGSGFLTGATVTFSTFSATGLTVSATQITGTVPSGPGTGPVTVTVTNLDTQNDTVSFTYNPAPSITQITPTSGPDLGGNVFTIDGSGFLAGATVTFASNNATGLTISATQITGTVPAGTAGAITVTVTNLDGQSDTVSYTYDPSQTHVLTGPTDFAEQERDGIDTSTTPGSFQLALAVAGFVSNGTRVTCIAYDRNSTNRLIVGTDSAGAFLTTDGGSSWTAFNAHSSPSLPSNNVLCANFFSPSSGPHTGGNVFIIGTDQGAVLTHDGGGAFKTYTTGSRPRVPGARVEAADFYDNQQQPTHFLLASNSGSNFGGGAACWTTDGGNHFKEFNGTSKPVALFGNHTTGVAYSPNSVNKFLIASYSPDSPQSNFFNEGGTGGIYLTVNGGGLFTRFATISGSVNTPSQGCTSVAFDPSDTVNGQRWAATFDGHAPRNSGSWSGGLWVTTDDGSTRTIYTTISSPSISSNDVRQVAYGGVQGEFVVATEAGLDVTTDGATSFSAHTTGTTVRIPDNFVNGCDMVSGGSSTTGTVGVATGQKTINSIGGGAAESNDNFTSASAVFSNLPTPSLLPHPNVRSVAVFAGNGTGSHLLAATGDGVAISVNGGTTWTIWDTTTSPALPSNDVRAVAWYDNGSTPQRYVVGTAAGIVVVNGVGGSPTFTTINSGLVSNAITCVDYFSGSASVTDTVIAGTNSGISIVVSATSSPTITNRHSGTTPAIASNTVRAVAFWHGQASNGRVAVATANGLSVSTDAFATVLNSTTSVTGLPSSDCKDVDFWDAGGSGNTYLVATASGAALTQNNGGAWTTFSQASTFGAMPANDVGMVEFFDAGSTAAVFAIGASSTAGSTYPFNITAGALLITTNGLAATPNWSRRQLGTAPGIPANMVSSFDFDESATGGTRWICGCTTAGPVDTTGTKTTGGLVLENGTTYRALGTLTIPQIEGGVMPRTSSTAPTWDSRFIRGAAFRVGSTQHLAVASLYGFAGSADGGSSFSVVNEATTPSFLSGVVLASAIYGGDGTGNTWVAATPAGPYFTTNGLAATPTWTLRSGNGLTTNDIRGIEFHHGVAGLVAAATSQGLFVSTNNGATWTRFHTGSSPALGSNDCRDVDFWDAASTVSGRTSGSIRVAVATNNGVYVTTTLTTGATPSVSAWTQRTSTGGSNVGNDLWAVRYDENDGTGATFWVGGWFSGTGRGGAASTANHGSTFSTVPTALQYTFVWDLDVHPGTSGHVLVGHQAGCEVTTNGGTSWTTHTFESTSGALPNSDTRRVSYSSNTSTWLAGTEDGLVVTTDGGTNFGPYLRGTLSQYSYLAVTETTTGGTIRYQILDANGALIPDATLSGNAAGLTPTGGQIDLSAIPVGTYPSIQVRVILTSSTGAATPSVQDLTLVYKY